MPEETEEKQAIETSQVQPADTEMTDLIPVSEPIQLAEESKSPATKTTTEENKSEPKKDGTSPQPPATQPATALPEAEESSAMEESTELDIDSMLKELDNQGGGLDLDAGNAEDNMEMDLGTFDDSGDVSSLLPGLENYVNINALDTGNAEKKTEAQQEKNDPATSAANDDDDVFGGLDIQDSKLDELFNFENMDFGENTSGADGMEDLMPF
jgi:hypothetical protein